MDLCMGFATGAISAEAAEINRNSMQEPLGSQLRPLEKGKSTAAQLLSAIEKR